MAPLSHRAGYSVQVVNLSGSIKNSTFARYRSIEAAAEERMRRQREARLQQRQPGTLRLDVSFIASARLPQRWTDE